MLPAVSSVDCLFAGLGIAAAADGCQILDATSYLTEHRLLDNYSSLILRQIRRVGDWSFGS